MFITAPIWARSFFDNIVAPEKQRTATSVRVFDSTTMPIDLALPSRMRTPQEIADLVVLVMHVTDINGGFGVSKTAIARWRKRLETGKVPAELLAQVDATDLGGASYELALVERYSRTAYHWLGSRRIGVIRNHPLALRTSHGDGGNLGLGVSIDCANEEAVAGFLVECGRAALDMAIDDAIANGGGRGVVVAHRCFSSGRLQDPGKIVWREITKPVIVAAQRAGKPVVIGYNTKAGSGRPIPSTWDSDALFDEKGRPLKAA